MNKKQLFIWSLYDFANSLIWVSFSLYFSAWIVVDAGLSDFWYNAIFPITTLLLFATAPVMAARTDRRGGRKLFLNIATVGNFLGYGLAAILASQHSSVWLVAIVFGLGQYFYQLAFVFYNPIVEEIADEAHRSRASGIGKFASSLGFVVGIALALPWANEARTAPLLPSVLAFFLLALPMMIFYKETRQPVADGDLASTVSLSKKMIAFFAVSAAAPVLLSFFFFSDALLTMSNNYSIYLERVFDVSDVTKSLLLGISLGASALGALFGGWVADRIGVLRTIKIILAAWIVIIPLLALAPSYQSILILTPITGLLLGAIWAVAPSYISLVLPKKDMGYGFSFYTLMERFATFVGPVTWGSLIWWLGPASSSYRIAMASMTVFVIIGLIVLIYWKRPVISSKNQHLVG